jgi:hypothetical protein
MKFMVMWATVTQALMCLLSCSAESGATAGGTAGSSSTTATTTSAGGSETTTETASTTTGCVLEACSCRHSTAECGAVGLDWVGRCAHLFPGTQPSIYWPDCDCAEGQAVNLGVPCQGAPSGVADFYCTSCED